MKKTTFEIKQARFLQELRNSYSLGSWNLDRAFAVCFLPIINKYIKNSKDIVKRQYFEMNRIEKSLFILFNSINENNYICTYLLNKATNKYLSKLNSAKLVLNDVLEEGTKNWQEKWKFKELLPVKYDFRRLTPQEAKQNSGPLIKMCINSNYADNANQNTNIIKYNINCFTKCLDWRKKHFNECLNIIGKILEW